MLNSITATIAGNVVDKELQLKKVGQADVVNFTVAFTPRVKVSGTENEYEDGDTTFIRVASWRREAQNVVNSLTMGDRVVVIGELKFRHYENDKFLDEEDNPAMFISVEMNAQEVGLSTAFATVEATRNSKGKGNGESKSGKSEGRSRRSRRSREPEAADNEF